jgi:glycosyltransferase involved in cell wall biosynthesis
MLRRLKQLRESGPAGEAYVSAQSLAQRIAGRANLPGVVIFPNEMYTGSSGDLRACAVGRELRRLGWRTLIVPPWLNAAARGRIIERERPAVILLHQSRHRLNRPALYPGIPCVFDADDADILNDANPVEECCRDSAAVIAGNHYLADLFQRHNPDVTVVWTGTYLGHARPTPNGRREPVVTWAQAEPFDYPMEAELVREVLVKLAAHLRFRFHLYGARDPGGVEKFLKPVSAAGVEVKTFPPLSYRPFVRSLEQAAIGLQPVLMENPFSRGKSFGKVLAYLAADVAVVASDAVDHALFFRHGENGMLARDVKDWVECCRFLLANRAKRSATVEAARRDLRERLTTRRAAELASGVLARAIKFPGRSRDFALADR